MKSEQSLRGWIKERSGSEELKAWAAEKVVILPRWIAAGLIRRILYGFRCGDFLEGVISGDLHAVMGHADSISTRMIPEVYRAVRDFPLELIRPFGGNGVNDNMCRSLSEEDRIFLTHLIQEL